MIDTLTKQEIVRAMLNGEIERNAMCWENAPCRTFKVRPIGLEDEAEYAIRTMLRVLTRCGYQVVKRP